MTEGIDELMSQAEDAEFNEWELVKTLALEGIPPESRPTFNLTGIYPTEFKVLILPDPVEEVTKGGIIVPTSKAEADKYATIEGRIVAVSHLAFTYATAEEWGDNKPKPGDRVIFAKYAGVRHKAKDGQEYLLVNDKDIVAVIE